MKHWLAYLCLTAVVVATGNLPFTSSDVGQLRPVQTIALSIQADQVVVQTDTGDRGIGDSWPTAWADLVLTAPGTIFVGTAGFLLLEESATGLLPQLLEDQALSPNCALCQVSEAVDLTTAGEFLTAHTPDMTLRTARAESGPLPKLMVEDGRYCLVQPGN